MFNKIRDSIRPFLPAGHMAGRPPRPAPEPPPRPKSSAVIQPTTGPPPEPKEEPVLELWVQSK